MKYTKQKFYYDVTAFLFIAAVISISFWVYWVIGIITSACMSLFIVGYIKQIIREYKA